MVKILIVEDDELILSLYQKIFSSQGYEVVLASNGEEGLVQAAATLPNLIMLDVMMPKLNGLEMLKRLKATAELKNIPVVMLTNLTGVSDAELALQLGAIKYIIKNDYKPREVFSIIQDIVSGYVHDGTLNTPPQ